MTIPNVQRLTILSTEDLAGDTVVCVGGFSNAITIRRFIETAGEDSAGTTALNIDDAGSDGSGTTAIADKSAAVIGDGFEAVATDAETVGASDGYKLEAGNVVKCSIDWTTPEILGYHLVMEYVDGVG